jgi:hypothetical protein
MSEPTLTPVTPQIDYSADDAPKTLNVVKHHRYEVPIFSISFNKTEVCGDDWFFRAGGRLYREGLEGFEAHTLNGKFWATVWLPINPEALTVAERINPGELTVAVIQSKHITV